MEATSSAEESDNVPDQRVANISKDAQSRISYIKSFFTQNKPFKWLNCVELDALSLRDYEASNYHLTTRFLVLGLSISRALTIAKDTKTLLLIVAQIFEEFEYHFSNQAMRVGRMVIARSAESHVPSDNFPEIFPHLIKFNNNVVYHALVLPQVAFDVSNARVTKSLLSSFEKVFVEVNEDALLMQHQVGEDQTCLDLLVRADQKLMHWVLGPIISGLNEQANAEFKLELGAFKRAL
jgi:hypothetical protein